MLEATLNLATLLGGLAALGYFVDRVRLRNPTQRVDRDTLDVGRQESWWALAVAITLRARIETPILVGAQWTVAVFLLSNIGLMAGLIGFLIPLWLLPLSLAVGWVCVGRPAAARIVGGLMGGLVSAGIGYLVRDWCAQFVLVAGGFLASLGSGFVAGRQKETSLVFGAASTLLLLSAVVALGDLEILVGPFGPSFVPAGLAAVVAVLVAVWLKLASRPPSKSRRGRGAGP